MEVKISLKTFWNALPFRMILYVETLRQFHHQTLIGRQISGNL